MLNRRHQNPPPLTLRERVGRWLLGSVKANPVSRLLYLMTAGTIIWTPREYEQLAQEGYNNSVTVYACVNTIARAIMGIRWGVFREDQAGRFVEVTEHPIRSLLARPNPRLSLPAFLETVVGFWLLSGNSYIVFVGPKSGPPKEMWPLRPDRMRIVPDERNLVKQYVYKLGGYEQVFDVSEVLHLKFFHPTNDWYGIGPIEVAARVIDADNEAVAWNMSLLQHAGRPSGALVVTTDLTDEAYWRLKREIDDHISRPRNAGRPLLLENGMDWKEMGLSPKDMDWLEGRRLTKREIAQAFNVPPELIGDSESKTYSNYQEARDAFYMETVLPLCDRLRDDLNLQLAPSLGPRFKIDYDRDDIEALQEDRTARWQRVQQADFLTINEKRKELGYKPVDGGDAVLVNGSLAPLSAQRSARSRRSPCGFRQKS